MKVILLVDVKKIGKKGEIVEVSDGYGSNFLIPKKLAVLLTDTSKKILDKEKEEYRLKKEEEKAKAIENREKLKDIVLEFQMKASPNGRMMGTVSYKQVEEALKDKYGIEIDKRKIKDKFLINAFGYTRLKIELFKDIVATINVHVSEMK